jgi:hypothetical protein
LYNERGKALSLGAPENVMALGHQLGAGDHFRYDEAGAQRISQPAERQI